MAAGGLGDRERRTVRTDRRAGRRGRTRAGDHEGDRLRAAVGRVLDGRGSADDHLAVAGVVLQAGRGDRCGRVGRRIDVAVAGAGLEVLVAGVDGVVADIPDDDLVALGVVVRHAGRVEAVAIGGTDVGVGAVDDGAQVGRGVGRRQVELGDDVDRALLRAGAGDGDGGGLRTDDRVIGAGRGHGRERNDDGRRSDRQRQDQREPASGSPARDGGKAHFCLFLSWGHAEGIGGQRATTVKCRNI